MRRITRELTNQGMRVSIVGPTTARSIERGESGERVINIAAEATRGGLRRVFEAGRVWMEAGKALRRLGSNVDVTLLVASLTSAVGLRTALLKRLGRKPVVLYVTGLSRPRAGYRVGLSSSQVLVGSKFLQRWFPASEVAYPLLPMGFGQSKRILKKPGDPFTVLFLGSFEPERGVEYLLEAMHVVQAQTERPVKLLIAWNGEGQENSRTIHRMIDRLGLEPMVDMRGWVKTEEVYSEADIVVIPRASEERMSFPIRILEAMHMRKALVVSRICGMENIVGGCGLAVEPRNAKALAEAILELAGDTALREALAENCSTAIKAFDGRHTVQALVGALRDAADRG